MLTHASILVFVLCKWLLPGSC